MNERSAELELELESHRPVLTGHCYRMLGSIADAEDAVQETMVRAWRSRDRFEGRSSPRTWLTRIATNVCLDAIAARARRRVLPVGVGAPGDPGDELSQHDHAHWIEPVPDALVVTGDESPAQVAIIRQSIRLAFVAALQLLPARQRAVLLLRAVLGWTAIEVAETLEMSVAAVNSALQRARATLSKSSTSLDAVEATEEDESVVDRYVTLFEAADFDGLVSLLHEDATFSMPPFDLWLRGQSAVRRWLAARGGGCRGSVLVPTRACGGPALGHYRDGGATPWAIITLEVEGDRIRAVTNFLDVDTLFPRFGLPERIER